MRLPDDPVDFVDGVAESGAKRSRASVVTRSLEREGRLETTARDVEILARTGPDRELTGLAEHATSLRSDLD